MYLVIDGCIVNCLFSGMAIIFSPILFELSLVLGGAVIMNNL